MGTIRGQFLGRVAAGDDGFSGEWTDMLGTFDQGTAAAALTFEEYRSAGYKAFFMRHDQNDLVYQKYQFSHAWMRTAVHLHAHVWPMSTWVPGPATKNVYFEIAYAWADDSQAVPDPSTWTTVNATLVLAPTDQYKRKYISLAWISPTAYSKESSCLLVRVTRLGLSGSDTYDDNKPTPPGTGAANLSLEYLDVHYQMNKPGTATETPP